MAAFSVAGAAGQVVTRTETVILNVPVSMLFMAIAGSMLGFFLLPSKDAARMTDHGHDEWRRRLAYRLLTLMPLAGFVIGYAFVASWTVQFGVAIANTVTRFTVDDALILPTTALVGVGIRLWLRPLLIAVQRRAERVIGGSV